MKLWHTVIALGVIVIVARAVNNYRATHYPSDGSGKFLTWGQGLKGVLRLGTYPQVQAPPAGGAVNVAGPSIDPTGAQSTLVTYDKL